MALTCLKLCLWKAWACTEHPIDVVLLAACAHRGLHRSLGVSLDGKAFVFSSLRTLELVLVNWGAV